MKELIVLSAVPGCGKSTWAHKYQETHKNTYILSSDDLRYELTGNYQDFSKQKEVWQLFEDRLIEYGKKDEDLTLILDAVIDLDSLREKYALLGKDFDKKTLVVLVKSLESIMENNKLRPKEKWVPEDALKMLYLKFETPSQKVIDLYDEYLYIDKIF